MSATTETARRAMEVCNACRYCEGYCAVFPAMELRREFTGGDLDHLANLCHNCMGCYHACQFAPPHEYGINVPKVFAELRQQSYATYAWPAGLATLYHRNGTVVALVTAAATAVMLLLTLVFAGGPFLPHPVTSGRGFYDVFHRNLMVGLFSIIFMAALLPMAIGLTRFWRATGGGRPGRDAWLQGLSDAATLRNLGGGGHGCNDTDESFSSGRRHAHHALAYGFLLCFAATATGTIYDHLLDWPAPYAFFSLPVLLGTAGGIGMVIGGSLLLWLKLAGDPAPRSRQLLGSETGLLLLLLLVAVTGLLLLALRGTGAMGMALAIHLGAVLSLFLLLPYSKFVHSLYRTAALVRNAMEHPR